KLVVDTAALVTLGADDHEAAGIEGRLLGDGDLFLDASDAAVALDAFETLGLLGDAHLQVAAELDVGTTARHVGGDGDGARHAGIGDDLGFLLVVAGVEHGNVGNAALAQQFGENLGLLDRGRADEHRLA